MKKHLFIMGMLIVLAAVVLPVGAEPRYKDGVFKAETKPDGEGYFCRAEVTVQKGKIVKCAWEIRDANRNNKLFDDKYGPEVYKGNAEYLQQCVDNLNGMKTFGPNLVKTQDPARVDAVTGATWARGKFQEALELALKAARR